MLHSRYRQAGESGPATRVRLSGTVPGTASQAGEAIAAAQAALQMASVTPSGEPGPQAALTPTAQVLLRHRRLLAPRSAGSRFISISCSLKGEHTSRASALPHASLHESLLHSA
jgi:hypothetical protein